MSKDRFGNVDMEDVNLKGTKVNSMNQFFNTK